MLRYWRETLKGLETLAWDAFDAVCVTAGERALAWWDRRNPNAHDIDMADLLADVEAEQEVWEPAEHPAPSLVSVLASMVDTAESMANAAELIAAYIESQEKPS